MYSTVNKPRVPADPIRGEADTAARAAGLAEAELERAKKRIAELETTNRELLAIADDAALVLAWQDIACLETKVTELRQALLALVVGLGGLPRNWILQYYLGAIAAQRQAAVAVLKKAGLL